MQLSETIITFDDNGNFKFSKTTQDTERVFCSQVAAEWKALRNSSSKSARGQYQYLMNLLVAHNHYSLPHSLVENGSLMTGPRKEFPPALRTTIHDIYNFPCWLCVGPHQRALGKLGRGFYLLHLLFSENVSGKEFVDDDVFSVTGAYRLLMLLYNNSKDFERRQTQTKMIQIIASLLLNPDLLLQTFTKQHLSLFETLNNNMPVDDVMIPTLLPSPSEDFFKKNNPNPKLFPAISRSIEEVVGDISFLEMMFYKNPDTSDEITEYYRDITVQLESIPAENLTQIKVDDHLQLLNFFAGSSAKNSNRSILFRVPKEAVNVCDIVLTMDTRLSDFMQKLFNKPCWIPRDNLPGIRLGKLGVGFKVFFLLMQAHGVTFPSNFVVTDEIVFSLTGAARLRFSLCQENDGKRELQILATKLEEFLKKDELFLLSPVCRFHMRSTIEALKGDFNLVIEKMDGSMKHSHQPWFLVKRIRNDDIMRIENQRNDNNNDKNDNTVKRFKQTGQ